MSETKEFQDLLNFETSGRQILGPKKPQQAKIGKSRITGAYSTFKKIGDIHNFKEHLSRRDQNSSKNMNHLKHSSNFQLLCNGQAKNLDHFHNEALKLSDNFTPLYAAYF